MAFALEISGLSKTYPNGVQALKDVEAHADGSIDLAFTGKGTGTTYSQQANNDPGDGYGRLIPTTSVDQYAATLAHWFLSGGGVDPTADIGLIFPNLGNFSPSANYDPANGYLGFV